MDVFEAAHRALREGTPAVLATVVGVNGSAPRHAGARMLLRPSGDIVGTVGGGALEHRVRDEAREVLRTGRPRRLKANLAEDLAMACGGSVEVYLEPLLPPPRLLIFGAGHVGSATALLATHAGFAVTLVDGREQWARPDRLPDCEVIQADPAQFASEGRAEPWDRLLLVTHSHDLDRRVLEPLARAPSWRWLGLIGSRKKVHETLAHLERLGIPREVRDRISAPVGLALGAETPEEIGISIVAELVAHRREPGTPTLPLAELRRRRERASESK